LGRKQLSNIMNWMQDDDRPDPVNTTGDGYSPVANLAQMQQERAEIVRNVHDEIGGALTALHFDLAWLATQPVSPAIQARVERALETLREAIQATQSITALAPPAILSNGLQPALRHLAQSLGHRSGIKVAVTCTGSVQHTPPRIAGAAYRIALEALNNIGKHARCQQASIAASASAHEFRLRIEDDGVGFESAAPQRAGHFGLRSMRERAITVGGRLTIARRPGHGTCVSLTVPLQPCGTATAPGDHPG